MNFSGSYYAQFVGQIKVQCQNKSGSGGCLLLEIFDLVLRIQDKA